MTNAATLSFLNVLLIGCACANDSAREAHPSSSELPSAEHLYIVGGKQDSGNIYPHTVLLTTSLNGQLETTCSGVLISPLSVLTAGHCVCTEKPFVLPTGEPATLIEGSTCLDQITVQVFMYGRSGFPRESLGVRIEPHPDLKLIYNSADTLVSGESDLAIIHLERPIKDIASVALATAQPASGSRVTIVGYGYTDLERSRLGVRYFGRTIISEISGELLRVAGPGAQAHEGDSGGPCLKWIRGEANPVLVGINRGGNAPFYSTFTSTAFPRNREWIEKIIRADLASP